MRIDNDKAEFKMTLILEFVRNYISINSIAPSFTEIRDGCNIKSTETVRRYLLKLEEEGYIKIKKIETVNMVARGIVVLK